MNKLIIGIFITLTISVAVYITEFGDSEVGLVNCSDNCGDSGTSQNSTSDKNKGILHNQAISSQSSDKEEPDAEATFTESAATKSYDDNWCVAGDELSQADADFANQEYQEWQIYLGNAAKKDESEIHDDDSNHPNNAMLASYQEMTLQELQQLANDGDKWAMVTFVQSWRADITAKSDIANELIVQGAPHFAIEHLVVSELAAAKSSYRETGNTNKSKDHIINAIVLALYGIENYSDAGLIAFAGNTSRNELFQGPLSPSVLLADSRSQIEKKYSDFVEGIEKRRFELQIGVESPPDSVGKTFQRELAILKSSSNIANSIEFLNAFELTKNVNLSNTECVEKHLASIKEKTN